MIGRLVTGHRPEPTPTPPAASRAPGGRARRLARRGLQAVALGAGLLLGTGANAQAPLDFGRCIDSLRSELRAYPKVRPETFARHTRDAQDLRPPIHSATRTQPEFQLPVWEYLAKLADDKRVRDGRALLDREGPLLQRAAGPHGVDAATVVAILGAESDFGRLAGMYRVVDATLSRACLRLGDRERKAHFFAALWLLQEGLVAPEDFKGSWAGAFGMTQFMPGTYVRHMSDGDGDGVVDTVRSMADAVATAAAYLNHLGWADGLPWGVEVIAPRDIARLTSSSEREHACLSAAEPQGRCRRLDQWAALGVVRADGRPLLDPGAAAPGWTGAAVTALLTPAGPQGPAWLVTRNFQVVWNYNRADAYALAIGLLSSALRGEPPLRAPWPTAEARETLSRTGMAALQELLVAAGQCEVVVDGYDGPVSRQAVRNEERRRGLPETGRPTASLLELLRREPHAASPACATGAAPAEGAPAASAPATTP
jgi:lytic murein transglycosylase